MDSAHMDSIELFTGAGGLALGTHLAGFRHLGLVEWNEDACATLRKNAKNARSQTLRGIRDWRVLQEDVRQLCYRSTFGGPQKVDLVAGGAPCQPFSLGGKHRAQDDARNMLPQFVRAVRELQPRAFILENVKGLIRQSFREYFEYIVLQLTYPDIKQLGDESWREHLARLKQVEPRKVQPALKYNVVSRSLNAADYGVPQKRIRVFIVGFRGDTELQWQVPEPTHSKDALMWDQYVTGDYWRKHKIRRPTHQSWHPPLKKIEEMKKFSSRPQTEAWRTVRDAFVGLPEPLSDRDCKRFSNHRINPGARAYPGHTGSPPDMPAKTLKAGVHAVPGGENTMLLADGSVRYFTVREAVRLQTFPDSWRFEGAWSEAMRQIGNAVPVELAKAVSLSVALQLNS